MSPRRLRHRSRESQRSDRDPRCHKGARGTHAVLFIADRSCQHRTATLKYNAGPIRKTLPSSTASSLSATARRFKEATILSPLGHDRLGVRQKASTEKAVETEWPKTTHQATMQMRNGHTKHFFLRNTKSSRGNTGRAFDHGS